MADGRAPRLFSSPSLYHLCILVVVDKFYAYKPYLVDLPKRVRFDLYYQVKGRPAIVVVSDGDDGRGGEEEEGTRTN